MAEVADREAAVIAGPKFGRDSAGNEVFTHVIDGANRVGPRPATEEDRKAHPVAYALFEAGADEPADPTVDVLKGETATLRSDLDKARSNLEGMTRERDQLKAENEALTKQRDDMLRNASIDSNVGSTTGDDATDDGSTRRPRKNAAAS